VDKKEPLNRFNGLDIRTTKETVENGSLNFRYPDHRAEATVRMKERMN
jgi:hypothetical protein